jgi:uncharacterized membrane protein
MLIIKNGRKIWVLPALVVVSMVLLSACGAQGVANPTAAIPSQGSTQAVSGGDAAGTDAPVSFKNDVLPILQSRCIKCHGGEKTEESLNLTSFDHLMAGSEKGPVVVASDGAKSKLIQMVQSGKMPKRSAKLLPNQIQILIDWINQGALNN